MSNITQAVANVHALNLDVLVDDLVRQGHSVGYANTAVEMYRQFLATHAEFPRATLVPTKILDLAWHAHLMRPVQYYTDCMVCFGHIMDHTPGVYGTPEYIEAYRITRSLVPFGSKMPESALASGDMAGAECYRPPVEMAVSPQDMAGAECYVSPIVEAA